MKHPIDEPEDSYEVSDMLKLDEVTAVKWGELYKSGVALIAAAEHCWPDPCSMPSGMVTACSGLWLALFNIFEDHGQYDQGTDIPDAFARAFSKDHP